MADAERSLFLPLPPPPPLLDFALRSGPLGALVGGERGVVEPAGASKLLGQGG